MRVGYVVGASMSFPRCTTSLESLCNFNRNRCTTSDVSSASLPAKLTDGSWLTFVRERLS